MLACELSVPGLLSQGQLKGASGLKAGWVSDYPFPAGSENAALREVADIETEQQQSSVGPENSPGPPLSTSSHLSPSKEGHFKKFSGRDMRTMGYKIT